jgi:Family of unknown function (DUF6519)/Chaperone of endosialidase
MKGDFTRFTFNPRKRYTNVFMQQGRLQLDADWNEQMSIQAYLNQRQAQDMIGETAGTPATEAGFRIEPTTVGTTSIAGQDLVIRPGRFYVNGLLCDLPIGAELSATVISARSVRVDSTFLEGQPLRSQQWLELVADKFLYQITSVDPAQRTLTFDRDLPSTATTTVLKFRRMTTYTTQVDYPTTLPQPGKFLVYLDVWQRHVTAIEDPELREVALNVPDTATRLQTIWQVKLLPLQAAPLDNSLQEVEKLPEWQTLIAPRSVKLNATTAIQPDRVGTTTDLGEYLGTENRLYRVEIHDPGKIGDATFKWSRDNGSIVSAIASINGNVIKLKNSIQEAYKLFKQFPDEQPWVEIISDEQELKNQPGIMVRITATKPPNQLMFDASQIRGGTVPNFDAMSSIHYKVRRWDQPQLATIPTSADWINLEDGIKIQFNQATDIFQTSDYWLIPARVIDRSIKWDRDDQGRSQPQTPQGIHHQYGFLAAVEYRDRQGFLPLLENSWERSDLRVKFLPLINQFRLGEGSLGVGTNEPWAKLHVQGDSSRLSNDTTVSSISGNPNQLRINFGTKKFKLFPGYRLKAQNISYLVTDAVNDSEILTVTPTVTGTLNAVPFEYQEPIIRFASSQGDAQRPEFFVTQFGLTAIGTLQPQAQLHVRALPNVVRSVARFETQDQQLGLLIDDSGQVGIGIEPNLAKLQVNGVFKIGDANNQVAISRDAEQVILATTLNRYKFDKGITIDTGALTVNSGRIVAASGNSITLQTEQRDRLQITADGQTAMGQVTDPTTLRVFGQAAIASSQLPTAEIPTNGLVVQGNILARSTVEIGTGNKRLILQSIGGQTNFQGADQYRFSNSLQVLTGGIIIADGGLGVSGGMNVRTGNMTVAQGDLILETGKISFGSGLATFDDSNGGLIFSTATSGAAPVGRLMITPNGTVTVTNPNRDTFLGVVGQMAIGTNFVSEATTRNQLMENGLVVQGHLGVGTNSPDAKLEVEGTSNRDDFSFKVSTVPLPNVTQLLFTVKNSGLVTVGSRDLPTSELQVNGDLVVGANVDRNTVPNDASIFTNGKIYAEDITSKKVQQLSSALLKENISQLSSQETTDLLQGLNPVKFQYLNDVSQRLNFGFIAEEVPAPLAGSDRRAIHPFDIVAVLTKAVKDHRAVIASLNRVVKDQQQAIARLNDRLNSLESKIQSSDKP